jgi:hypothetical protein
MGDVRDEFYSPDPKLNRIVYFDPPACFQRTTSDVFQVVNQNDIVLYLYKTDNFFASAIRSNNRDLLLTEKKIVRCEPWEGHLMAKYEGDDEAYLILLCYSSFYDIPLNMAYPGDRIKSARSIQ